MEKEANVTENASPLYELGEEIEQVHADLSPVITASKSEDTIASSPEPRTKDPESLTDNLGRVFEKPVAAVANLAQTAAQNTVNTVAFVIPKIEPLPWYDLVFLSIMVAIPAAVYILVFTKIGFGIEVFKFISVYFHEHSFKLGGSLAGFALFLFIFDCYYWKSAAGRMLRYAAISIIVLGLAVLVTFIASTHPYGPISVYVVQTPIWLVMVRFLFYRKKSVRQYVPSLSGPLFVVSMVTFVVWFAWSWLDTKNGFTPVVKLFDAQALGCAPDFENYPECKRSATSDTDVCFDVDVETSVVINRLNCPEICSKVYDTSCAGNTFILWAGPFLVSLGLLFLSFFATFLKGDDSTVEKEAMKFAKIWGFLLFAMWISASLAGAGAGLSTTLAALTLSSFVASAVFLASSYSQMERIEQVRALWNKLLTNYAKYLNIAKGLLVVTCAPVAAIYLAMSFLVQAIRKIKLPCSNGTKPKDDKNESMGNLPMSNYITDEASQLVAEVMSWDMVAVFTYAVYWGLGFITMSVIAAKFTIVFLSWLIEATQDLDLLPVVGILIGVGVVMFLLPPVPGAPIYLTLGIVMVPVGRKTLGLVWCIVFAMGVSLVLKLFATFLQQKMIGGLLKNKVGVRQLVGMNTPLIRTMKLLLAERGLGAAKVAILCGGPDWPTSVLCGLMDLPLVPVLVGTLPVFGLIVPTVLAGSFTYMAGLQLDDGTSEFPWAGTASTICLALASMVLFGCMLSAAYYVEQAMSTRAEDLAKIEIDVAVRDADEKEEASKNAFKAVTEWKLVPIWAQICLLLSLACMITSCYLIQLFQEEAFTEYQLTYTIDKHLSGDWKNLVKPLGWIGLLLFAVSLFFLFVFNCWAKNEARRYLRDNSPTEEQIQLSDNSPEKLRQVEVKADDSLELSPSIEVQTTRGFWGSLGGC